MIRTYLWIQVEPHDQSPLVDICPCMCLCAGFVVGKAFLEGMGISIYACRCAGRIHMMCYVWVWVYLGERI